MESLNETTSKKAAKRRSMTPVRLLRSLEEYLAANDKISDNDTIDALIDALSESIVAEAIAGR